MPTIAERLAPAPTSSAQVKPPTPPASMQPPKATPPPVNPGAGAPRPKGADGQPTPPAQVTLQSSIKALFNETTPPPAAVPAEPPKAAEPPKEPAAPPAAAPAEPPKEPATPPSAADPFAGIAQPDKLSEEGQKGWKALKEKASSEIAAREKELADAKAQLDQMRKATPADTADLERIKSELKAAHDRLAVLDLQSHPDFARQYVEPRTKALAEAKMLLSDNGVADAPDLAALLTLPRAEFAKKVSELASKMQTFDQGSFTTVMRDAFRLTGESKDALAKAGELRSGLEQKAAQEHRSAFEEVYGKASDADGFVKPLPIPETASPDDRAELMQYNSEIPQVRKQAESYAFGKLSPKDAAAVASKAATLDFMVKRVMPRMNREHEAVKAERDALAAELVKLRGAKNPGNFSSTPGSDGAPQKPKTLNEQIKDLFKQG